ncbi:MAG: hypothetical protein ACK5HY_03605 [Parahaliea sp.]
MRALLAALGLLLASGCTQWHYELGSPLTAPGEDFSVSGGSTLAEVLARFGPPLYVSSNATGLVMAWEYWRIREDSLGVNLGALGADALSLDWGKAHFAGEYALVAFSPEHRVTASSHSRINSKAGGGAAIQPFGVVEVVSVEDMTGAMPQHQWGATLLDRLPRALNADKRPNQGGTGVQQRGTPGTVGQQTLELE